MGVSLDDIPDQKKRFSGYWLSLKVCCDCLDYYINKKKIIYIDKIH